MRMSLISTIVSFGLWTKTSPTSVIFFLIENHAINSNIHKAESDWGMITTKVNTCAIKRMLTSYGHIVIKDFV
jgi:hypothetical protein